MDAERNVLYLLYFLNLLYFLAFIRYLSRAGTSKEPL
jgi:hypothetical protein